MALGEGFDREHGKQWLDCENCRSIQDDPEKVCFESLSLISLQWWNEDESVVL